MVDYNGNYTRKQALTSIREITDYDIVWVEEPVPPEDITGYRELSRKTDVPLAAGEVHFGRFELKRLVEEGNIDVLQPNLGRCGGSSEARYLTNTPQPQMPYYDRTCGTAASG